MSGVCHTTQLVLSSELATELPIRSYELLAHIDHDLARGDSAICLDTDHDLGDVGMGHFVSGHQDMGSLLQVLAEKIAESVVFLEQDEVRRVGHACKRLLGDLLLPGGFIEEKELETIWRVHLAGFCNPPCPLLNSNKPQAELNKVDGQATPRIRL